MTTFNIGSQNAASIQNIGGDAVITGGVHASATQHIDLRRSITRVQAEAARVPLDPPARATVDCALNAAAAEAARDAPDRGRVAELLATATRALHTAGAFGAGAATLVEAIRQAATVLGPVGQAAVALF
jgi:hypothetical protein